MIGDVGDWHVHKYLREMNLRGNFINRVGTGLLNLKELRMLDLSENYLSCISHLDGLHLQTLFVAQNRLTTLDGVSTLSKLQVLNVRHNNITTIEALNSDDVPRLRKLCVADNRISRIKEVAALASFPFLCDLFLAPSPITELPHYRAQVLHRLPRLRSLDAVPATANEKVKADLIYGADIDMRQEIFTELLPEETFVDRRLITDEGIAQLEEDGFGKQGDAGPYGGADVLGVERTMFQEARFRRRLAQVRSGEARVADFRKIAEPFVSFRVCDDDIQAIIEACSEGKPESLLLGDSDLTVRGVLDLLTYLQEMSRTLQHVDLSGCAAVSEWAVSGLGRGLIKGFPHNFPFAGGISLDVSRCGLSEIEASKLCNDGVPANEARRRFKMEWERSEAAIATYNASQRELDDFASGHSVMDDDEHGIACQELTTQAENTYDASPPADGIASGQLMAHLSYLALNCCPKQGDELKSPAQFKLKRLRDASRPRARRGEDIHSTLGAGLINLEAAVGSGFGPGSVSLLLVSNSKDDVEVVVRRGSIFQQSGWTHRSNLIVVVDTVVKVPAGQRVLHKIEAYSMNRSCAIPNGNPLSLTEFYFDELDIMQNQARVWDHFQSCIGGTS